MKFDPVFITFISTMAILFIIIFFLVIHKKKDDELSIEDIEFYKKRKMIRNKEKTNCIEVILPANTANCKNVIDSKFKAKIL